MSPMIAKFTPLLLASAVGLGGCATKSFVREEIAPVSARVTQLETALQATDGTAKQALAEAQAASSQMQGSTQRLEQLNGRVDSLDQQMQAQANRGRRPRN